VSLQFIEIGADNGTSTSFILQKETGDHSIVMYRGNNDQLLDAPKLPVEFDSTKWYYVTDLTAENNDPTVRISEFSAKNGIKIAFIPGQKQLGKGIKGLQSILNNTEILILNAYEAINLVCPTLEINNLEKGLDSLKAVLSKLSEFGPKTVVITADVKGAIARNTDGEFFFIPAPSVDRIVNTVGAGDAFASSFVAGIIRGKGIPESLDFAVKNVGEVLKSIGSQSGLIKTKL
jgi:sugar/nucleoside kinase (ribokinase family)